MSIMINFEKPLGCLECLINWEGLTHKKQAKNGLQLQSSKNGQTAVQIGRALGHLGSSNPVHQFLHS